MRKIDPASVKAHTRTHLRRLRRRPPAGGRRVLGPAADRRPVGADGRRKQIGPHKVALFVHDEAVHVLNVAQKRDFLRRGEGWWEEGGHEAHEESNGNFTSTFPCTEHAP